MPPSKNMAYGLLLLDGEPLRKHAVIVAFTDLTLFVLKRLEVSDMPEQAFC